jgi:polysaccharide deacetylase family protein (PEP-CTERM system associated)
MNIEKYILLTVDVEDWFQVENFRPWIPFETWDQYELRVERNVHRLLDLFDSIKLQPPSLPATKNRADDYQLSAMSYELKNNGQLTKDNGHTKKVCATFFVLGWIAEKLPNLIREIHARGHEVASHGYNHNLCNQQSHSALKRELADSKKLLEDIVSDEICGFRAPNFSINDDTLKIAEDSGYFYDSSYNSFNLNSRYGEISLNGHNKNGIAHKISDNFFELPISNIQFKYPLNLKRNNTHHFILPWGGGAYFRLIPYRLFKHGVKSILDQNGAYVFYMHPWEIDPGQPHLKEASYQLKLRHYNNIKKTSLKLSKLLNEFQQCSFATCSQYLAFKPSSFQAF